MTQTNTALPSFSLSIVDALRMGFLPRELRDWPRPILGRHLAAYARDRKVKLGRVELTDGRPLSLYPVEIVKAFATDFEAGLVTLDG